MGRLVHDLRQPLSNVELSVSYLGLILPESNGRAQQQLQILGEQVKEANRVISEILLVLKRDFMVD